MAAEDQQSHQGVSLFPFLSVLACVIGTLTLLIAAMALWQIQSGALSLGKKNGRNGTGVEEVKQRIAEAVAIAERTRSDLRVENKTRQDSIKRATAEIASLRQGIVRLEQGIARAGKEIETARVKLADRNRKPKPATIMVQPGGTGKDLQPQFVECTENGIVVYSQSHGQDFRVSKTDIERSPKFKDFLKRVKDKPRASVIFLVRPNGVQTYYDAAYEARKLNKALMGAGETGVRHGKLPVPGEGQIDLSLFQNVG